MKSRNGIYYDLARSEYTADAAGITFYFSSALHLAAFLNYEPAVATRYGFNTSLYWLETFREYRRIETRGFYVMIEGTVITCPEQLIFTDRVQIQK